MTPQIKTGGVTIFGESPITNGSLRQRGLDELVTPGEVLLLSLFACIGDRFKARREKLIQAKSDQVHARADAE